MRTALVTLLVAALVACSEDPRIAGDAGSTSDASTVDAGHMVMGGSDAGVDSGTGPAPAPTPLASQLTCGLGELDCDGACTNVATDGDHCGGCGHACPAGQTCGTGICGERDGGVACSAAEIDCGGECKNIGGDAEECGACGHKCASHEFCYLGTCVCRPELTNCDGACVDTESDPANCGGCDMACDGTCSAGTCGDAAACELEACDGACVDIASHPLHCGGCGNACPVDQVCFAGGCWDYAPPTDCESCDGCDCGGESCCELEGYGISCVDTPQACP